MNTPPTYPTRLTPQEPDIEARLARIETRLVRLMNHMGLQSDGTPLGLPYPPKPKSFKDAP